METCRKNKWEFILVLKEGAMPKVYRTGGGRTPQNARFTGLSAISTR